MVYPLGRIPPVAVEDAGRFKRITLADGRVKYVPRLAAHFRPRFRTAAVPTSTNWRAKGAAVIKTMLGNNSAGNCVIASALHRVGLFTANDAAAPALSNDAEALAQYHAICGRGDNGCIITDVLDVQVKSGLKLGGVTHRIDGYCYLDHTNKALMQTCLQVFGPAVNFGLNLPNAWHCTDCDWKNGPTDSIGGHDVTVADFDPNYVYVLTWGGLVRMEWAAVLSKHYIDECYLSLSPDWYGKDNLAPNGIDVDTLRADLAIVEGGGIPPFEVPPPPPPPPPPAGNKLNLTTPLPAGAYAIGAKSMADGSILLPPALAAELRALLDLPAAMQTPTWFAEACAAFRAGQLGWMPAPAQWILRAVCAMTPAAKGGCAGCGH